MDQHLWTRRGRRASRSAVIQNAEYFDPSSSDDGGDTSLAGGPSRARQSVLLFSRVQSQHRVESQHSSLDGSGTGLSVDLAELEEGEIDEAGLEDAGEGFFIDRRRSGKGQDVATVGNGGHEAGPGRSPAAGIAGLVMSTLSLAAAADWRAPDPAGHLPTALTVDVSRLHHQLVALAASASPTPAQRERTAAALVRVETSVKRALPGCRVILFGSNANHLALPDSDLDLVAVTAAHAAATALAAAAELRQRMEDELAGRRAAPNGRKRRREAAVASGAVGGGLTVAGRKEAIKPLRVVMRQVVRDGIASRDESLRPEVIKAKVPIVKFVEARSGMQVDLCVNTTNGAGNSAWIRSTLERRPQLRPVVLVLKLLLRRHGLQDTYTGGVGSYLLFAMADKALELAGVPESGPGVAAGKARAAVQAGVRAHNGAPRERPWAAALQWRRAAAGDAAGAKGGDAGSAPGWHADLGLLLLEVLDRFVHDSHFAKPAPQPGRAWGGHAGRGGRRHGGRWRNECDAGSPPVLEFDDPMERGSDIGSRAFRWGEAVQLFRGWLRALTAQGCLGTVLPGLPANPSVLLTSSQLTRLGRPLEAPLAPAFAQHEDHAEPEGRGRLAPQGNGGSRQPPILTDPGSGGAMFGDKEQAEYDRFYEDSGSDEAPWGEEGGAELQVDLGLAHAQVGSGEPALVHQLKPVIGAGGALMEPERNDWRICSHAFASGEVILYTRSPQAAAPPRPRQRPGSAGGRPATRPVDEEWLAIKASMEADKAQARAHEREEAEVLHERARIEAGVAARDWQPAGTPTKKARRQSSVTAAAEPQPFVLHSFAPPACALPAVAPPTYAVCAPTLLPVAPSHQLAHALAMPGLVISEVAGSAGDRATHAGIGASDGTGRASCVGASASPHGAAAIGATSPADTLPGRIKKGAKSVVCHHCKKAFASDSGLQAHTAAKHRVEAAGNGTAGKATAGKGPTGKGTAGKGTAGKGTAGKAGAGAEARSEARIDCPTCDKPFATALEAAEHIRSLYGGEAPSAVESRKLDGLLQRHKLAGMPVAAPASTGAQQKKGQGHKNGRADISAYSGNAVGEASSIQQAKAATPGVQSPQPPAAQPPAPQFRQSMEQQQDRRKQHSFEAHHPTVMSNPNHSAPWPAAFASLYPYYSTPPLYPPPGHSSYAQLPHSCRQPFYGSEHPYGMIAHPPLPQAPPPIRQGVHPLWRGSPATAQAHSQQRSVHDPRLAALG